MKSDSNTVRVAATASLAIGEAKTFYLPDSDVQGLVLRTPVGLRAFRNQCRHWTVELDAGDADFWNPDLKMIQCKVHGALFRPEDGLCVYGPCSGHPLIAYELTEDGEDSLVTVPPS